MDTRTLAVALLLICLAAAALLMPGLKTRATGLIHRTESHADDLPNYDIRTDKNAVAAINNYRGPLGRSAENLRMIRQAFRSGEEKLRLTVPSLKIEYDQCLRIPEVIGSGAKLGRNFLTGAVKGPRDGHADILINFLKENNSLIGLGSGEIDRLKIAADYTNPDGVLSFVELDQEIGGIPVFRGEVKAGFTKAGEMIRVINDLAPGIDENGVSTDFGEPSDAVKFAAGKINVDPSAIDMQANPSSADINKFIFGKGVSATTAEKIYFPTEPGVVVPAWRVLIWRPVNAFYIIVDAHNGTMLWRKNITEDQTQSATYSVYTKPNAMMNVANNPFPVSPGTSSPNGIQGAALSRTSITRIGNEPPYTFNNNGWIPDGGTVTDGNAVQAGLDRDIEDGVDANSEALSPTRNFTYNYSPFDPNTNSGGEPVPSPQTYPGSAFQQGSATQLFYICNWYHDQVYLLGFTEAARNFQDNNFGRGGLDGDRIRGEGQDSSGTANANFSTPADGTRGRMQMYLWPNPNPDIDGDLDADVVIHEHTHGLSNRLHGNGSGLSTNMSRGLGEGWSDFYAHCLLSQPSDPVDGIYTIGAYDTYVGFAGYVNNNYYGIRRFPKAIMSSVGPNGRPHNPLTFADVDGQHADLSDGAFPRGPYGSSIIDQVHNLGEVWSSALWEVRAKMVTRLGWAAGNKKALQLVTDGMKLAPLAPTFVSERDAIIAAAQASSTGSDAGADIADVWAGFAIRGIGASASIQSIGTGFGDTHVTEAFDLPNIEQSPDISINDQLGNNNGYADPGETVSLQIPLTNMIGPSANGVTLRLNGGNAISYGSIAYAQTVTRSFTYTIPSGQNCGSLLTLTLSIDSDLGPITRTRYLAVGTPTQTFNENFDNTSAPSFPNGWTATPVQGGINFVTNTADPDSPPNAAFAMDPASVGGGSDLISPSIPITAQAAILTFRHRYDTEPGWDGGSLEISIADGAFQDIAAMGGTFLEGGYDGVLGMGTNNPLAGRAAWSGSSNGYKTTVVRLPAAAAGQNVRLKWRFGADDNTAEIGWYIDNITVTGAYLCSISDNFASVRADFDGDGRSDLSIYRPIEGNWYLDRSSAGFTALHFGLSTDIITPGDFDGDRRTDVAVWRPSSGTWFLYLSSSSQLSVIQFGSEGDIPSVGDLDGDGKSDISVFRPSNGVWYRLNSGTGAFVTVQFGQNGDMPVVGDYDGDGKADIAVFRPSAGAWFRINSADGSFSAIGFGLSSDIAVPADYDGDGKTDICVFRPSDGNWYRLNSSDLQLSVTHFGQSGDVPAPGDYDGDGKYDQAVYRNGIWYLNRSSAGFSALQFGLTGDIPVPNRYFN